MVCALDFVMTLVSRAAVVSGRYLALGRTMATRAQVKATPKSNERAVVVRTTVGRVLVLVLVNASPAPHPCHAPPPLLSLWQTTTMMSTW